MYGEEALIFLVFLIVINVLGFCLYGYMLCSGAVQVPQSVLVGFSVVFKVTCVWNVKVLGVSDPLLRTHLVLEFLIILPVASGGHESKAVAQLGA